MEYWVSWIIVAAIGLVMGLIVHGIIKFAQGSSLITILIAGIVGALAAAYFVTPVVGAPNTSRMAMFYMWAVLGGLVLSAITELFFAGERRGRVVIS